MDTKNATDPRIANVLARLDDWQSVEANPDTEAVAEAGRYVRTLFESVNFDGMAISDLRQIIVALASVADDEVLDALHDTASDEQRVFLECTVGNEIAAAIKQCGVTSGYLAERIAHNAIHEALAIVRRDGEQPATEVQQ